jgi:hypothetical protein
MTEWDLISKMQELANRNANVPPAMAKVLNSINAFSSIIDPSLYASCCTVSAEDDSGPGFGCNNPYGDGSDPTYVCQFFKEGKCSGGKSKSCKEKYSLEELD